ANFEVTTLRIDTESDGRHATVVFTDDWRLDSARRDLTVNSMFLSVNVKNFDDNGLATCNQPMGEKSEVTGRLFDFFGGRKDLSERRIRFVGQPVDRIKEDYLRILRYFRFHGRLSKPEDEDSHDADIIEAITQNGGGLGKIAGERCWVELRQILLCRSAPALLHRMRESGLFCHLGLPKNADLTEMGNLWRRGILSRSPNPATCLASILSTLDEVSYLHSKYSLNPWSSLIALSFAHYPPRSGLCCYLSKAQDIGAQLIVGIS
ncbi:CCA tRNA nucleotidyltransferase 1 mitochondrial, partial [Fasciolopsis buskii]